MPYGSLIIKFAADTAEFQRDIGRTATLIRRDISGAIAGATRALAIFGTGASAAGFGLLIKHAIDVQDELNKMSQKVGVSVESLSGLRYAASLSDVSLGDLGSSLAKLSKNMSDSADGSGDAAAAFKALRIEVKSADGGLRSSEQVFGDVADAFAQMEDGAGKTAIAIKIFGRSGAELIPLLNQGRDGLREMHEEAKEFGVIFGTDAAQAAERFNDSLTKIGFVIEGIATAIGASFLPAMADWIDANLKAIKIAGGLTEALNLFVFDLNAMTTEHPVEQIKRLNSEIIELERLLSTRTSASGLSQYIPTGKDLELLDKYRKQVQFLNVLLEQQTKRNLQGTEFEGFDEALARAQRGVAKGRAPLLADPKKAEDEAGKLLALQKQLGDASENLAISRAEAISRQEQITATNRLRILDRFHSQGLVEEQDYWRTRLSIQQEAIAQEIAAVDAEIQQRERAVATALEQQQRGGKDSGKAAVEYLKATKDLEAAQQKRITLEREAGQIAVESNLDAEESAQRYRDAVESLNAQLAELQGRSADAAAIRFEQQTRAIRAQARRDPATQQIISDLEKATVSQASFNDAVRDGEFILRGLALQEERINNSREAGAISEFKSLKEISAAREESLVQLSAIADEMQAIAAESKNVFLIQQAEAFRIEVEKLASQTDLLAQKFDQISESAFADFLTEVLDDVKSVEDAFKRMVDSIIKQINRLASEEIANVLFKAIRGEGKGGGIGQVLAGIFSGDFSKQIAGAVEGAGQSIGDIQAKVKPIWEFEGIEPPTVSVNTQPVWDFAGIEPPKVSIPTEPAFDFAGVNIPKIPVPTEPQWDFAGVPQISIPTQPEWDFARVPQVVVPTQPEWNFSDVKIPTISVPTEPVLDFVDMERAIKTISVPVESAGPIQVSTPDELTIPVEGLFKGLTDVPAPTEIPVEGIWKGLTEAVEPIKIPIEGLWKGLASSVEPIDVPINGLFQGLASAAGGAGYYAAADISNLFLQNGGRVKAGHAYVVGDGGEPEWFVPDTAGSVIPFSEMSSGGGRMTVINQFTISGQTDRRSQDQIALAAARGVQRSLDRNG
jgi:hypothetical protein